MKRLSLFYLLSITVFFLVMMQILAAPSITTRGYTRPSIMPSQAQLQKPNATTATFVVNSTGDGGDSNLADNLCNDGTGNCTLRAAMQQANSTAGADLIQFSIGSGPQLISPATALPSINGTVTIDGTTQPGFTQKPIIEISGNPSIIADGLSINQTATGTIIKGLVINKFESNGIQILANNCHIESCFIGTNLAGTAAAANTESGVLINGASNNVIGGTAAGAGNLISGNDGNGILIFGAAAATNRLEGNFIGTNFSGNGLVGNAGDGVFIGGDAHDNTVGGTATGARNVISGNINGIHILKGTVATQNNLIQGNYIGTDSTGAIAFGNTVVGIDIFEANNNTIGGTIAAARNVIAGNNDGIIINQPSATGNIIQGNYIGVAANGVSPAGNHLTGITLLNGAHDNTIGGTGAGAGNVIAFNGTSISNSAGIFLNSNSNAANPTTNNAILGNSIFSNLGLGIDICGTLGPCANPDGVTANDVGDGDTGTNDKQNFPILTSATTLAAGTVNIQGSLNSTANTTLRIEFFSNPSCDAAGNCEGRTFLGTTDVTTNASGNASINATLSAAVPGGSAVTATATRLNVTTPTSTSEFSSCITSIGLADLMVAVSDSPDPVVVGSQITYTITVTNNGPDPAANITVSENLPSSLQFSTCPSTAGGTCGGTGNNRTITFTSLAATASATITIKAVVNCNNANNSSISNTASVTSSTADNVSSNNSASTTTTVNNPGASLSPTSQSFVQPGGSGTVDVTVPFGCSWSAVSNDSWITVVSGGGFANGTVSYTVAANGTGSNRSGSMTIANITFNVDQLGAPCSYTLTPSSVNLSDGANSGSFTITCAAACGWKATPQDDWIRVTSNPVGNGNGTVSYEIDANPSSAPRVGSIDVTGSPFTINQAGMPTAVKLIAFNATAYDTGVLLDWASGDEVDNLGFNLYRDEGGKLTRLTPEVLAGSALTVGSGTVLSAGKHYAWWDAAGKDRQPVQYWLEDLDLSGARTMHGPITAKVVGGLPPAKAQADLLSNLGRAEPRFIVSASGERNSARNAQPVGSWDLFAKSAIKIGVREDGWYRVTQPELVAAGLATRINPRLLQLLVDGEAVPMLVTGEEDGSFDATDAIEFYGTALDTTSTNIHVYWLSIGTAPGRRINVVKSDARAGGAQNFAYTIERKDRLIYFSSLHNGDAENFFGAVVTASPIDQTIALPRLDTQSKETAIIEVRLQGVTKTPHLVRVGLGGSTLGNIGFTGQAQGGSRIEVPVALLKEGGNQISLAAIGGASDVSLVDFIRITYPHTYKADNNALTFTVNSGSDKQSVGGFTTASIRVFDISRADAVQELQGSIEQTGEGYSVNLQTNATSRTLLALGADKIKKPASITANRLSDLRAASHSADLLIVTHSTFASSLTPLVNLRRQQGYRVEVIDIEDIYDEFSFGQKQPTALKDFLASTRTNWQKAPRFVLLVGDASYDPKGYLGAGDFDFVPSQPLDTAFMETISDDGLVDFNNDGLPDLFVGRLPVRTAAEAAALVAKLINYDSLNPKAPVQQKSAVLVADSNDGFNFEAANRNLRALLPDGVAAQEIVRGQVDDATARQRLIDGFNKGASVVNYLGHGSVNTWHGILSTEDVKQLTNRENPSLVIAMTCLIGYIQDPSIESLAESLLKSEQGGAIAVWASSSMTEPAEQVLMNAELYRSLFSAGNKLTLGELTAKAKAAAKNSDIRRTWLLLGDPTMRLK
jgi:uncharacterized repeat protein (TIGR01451 family)